MEIKNNTNQCNNVIIIIINNNSNTKPFLKQNIYNIISSFLNKIHLQYNTYIFFYKIVYGFIKII